MQINRYTFHYLVISWSTDSFSRWSLKSKRKASVLLHEEWKALLTFQGKGKNVEKIPPTLTALTLTYFSSEGNLEFFRFVLCVSKEKLLEHIFAPCLLRKWTKEQQLTPSSLVCFLPSRRLKHWGFKRMATRSNVSYSTIVGLSCTSSKTVHMTSQDRSRAIRIWVKMHALTTEYLEKISMKKEILPLDNDSRHIPILSRYATRLEKHVKKRDLEILPPR